MYAELSSASSSPSSCCSPRFPSPRRTGSGMNGRAMAPQQRRGNRQRTRRSLMLRKSLMLLPILCFIFVIFLKVPHSSLKVPFPSPTHSPGSEYRSPQLFDKLWPLMLKDNSSPFGNAVMRTWQRAKLDQGWRPCISKLSLNSEPPPSNGYMVIEANGGLNQQRMSICDAVAVAGLLNATLVIPDFHFNSIWRDSSNFSDIFDEEHFIRTLQNDVRIVRRLPTTVLEKFNFNISSIVNLRLKASTSVKHYLKKVLPNLIENGVIRVSPFANRLPSEVPPRIQHLRCLANYEALRFSKPISSLADKLLNRMIEHSSDTNGKYVSIHLRFEEDMVAFSCCVYDGDKDEKSEMDAARERGWRGKFHRVGRVIRPSAIRLDGKCPLTPLEVGMMLRGMGYNNDTSVYLAAGKIYKAEKYMEPLKRMFPRLQTKETLATAEELAPFKRFSSRMAALDYTVCLNSEVFVTTQGGNFPHFLMGHRRYLNKGHSKTIKPDKRKLVLIFDNLDARWSHFKRDMQMMLHRSDLKGVEMKKVNGSIYSFPAPDCMCRHTTS